jgi:acid phosphatase class B
MIKVESPQYNTIFKKVFRNVEIFTGLVEDFTGIHIEIDEVENDKVFAPPIVSGTFLINPITSTICTTLRVVSKKSDFFKKSDFWLRLNFLTDAKLRVVSKKSDFLKKSDFWLRLNFLTDAKPTKSLM